MTVEISSGSAKTALTLRLRILARGSIWRLLSGSLMATVTLSPSELSTTAPTRRAMSTGSCSNSSVGIATFSGLT